MRPVPPGVPGEIYVGGAGVGRGYVNEPALTARSFLPDPFSEESGARLYRKSGSWRQWHSDSALVEQGGYRYIAVALAEHPEGGRWMEDLIAALHRLVVPADVAGAGS